MLLLTTTLLALLLLFLPHPTMQSCITATRARCHVAPIAPGSTLAGEGFDITTMQPKMAFVIDMNTYETKNGTCTLCKNPYRSGQMQKIPTSVVSWRPSHKCSATVKSTLLESALSVAEHVSKSVKNDWKVGLDLRGTGYGVSLSGTESSLTKTVMAKSKQDRFMFTSHSMHCGFFSYMVSSKPKLSPGFNRALRQLPHIYSPSTKGSFDDFIDKYGTHFMEKVQVGGKIESITSIRECRASLMSLSVDDVQMCLTADISAKLPYGMNADVRAETSFCNDKKQKMGGTRSFLNKFHERVTEVTGGQKTRAELFSANTPKYVYQSWLESLPSNPNVISYSLKPLHQLVSNRRVKRELKQAIKDYILRRGLRQQCYGHCKLGIRTKPGSCACHCRRHKGLGTNCCPTRLGQAEVSLTIIKGEGLYGDYSSGTDGYVKVYQDKIFHGKTPMITDNNNPQWNYIFNIGDTVLSAHAKLKIEVWDEDTKYDDLLGTCYAKLKSNNRGVKVCSLKYGRIFYRLKVTCGPSLSGPSCNKYVKSPMSSVLEELYVSRHAQRIPKHMLFQMGMRLDAFNYTLKGQSPVQNGGGKADWL